MDLVGREKVPKLLKLFGMEYGDAGVQAAQRACGFKPTRYEGVAGGRGRIALLDPMVAWLIVSTWEANKRRFAGLDRAMDDFRKLYPGFRKSPDAKYIPGFVDDPELGAQLLMLCSPLYGMEPRDIRRMGREEPRVFDLSQHGRAFMINVLQAYNDVYGHTIASLRVDPPPGKAPSVKSQTREFLGAWLHEARMRFEADEYYESGPDGPGYVDGGEA